MWLSSCFPGFLRDIILLNDRYLSFRRSASERNPLTFHVTLLDAERRRKLRSHAERVNENCCFSVPTRNDGTKMKHSMESISHRTPA